MKTFVSFLAGLALGLVGAFVVLVGWVVVGRMALVRSQTSPVTLMVDARDLSAARVRRVEFDARDLRIRLGWRDACDDLKVVGAGRSAKISGFSADNRRILAPRDFIWTPAGQGVRTLGVRKREAGPSP